MTRPRVLVTGGTGAVGAATVRHLRRDADVVAIARRRPARLPADVEFVAADVRDADAVRKAVAGCDAVVHLAWAVSVHLSADDATATNVGGTTNLVEAAADAGVARLVFCSSVTAYGSDPAHVGRYAEEEPLRAPDTFLYASHKARMEALVDASGIANVRVRLGTVLGRGVDNSVSHLFTGPVVSAIRGREMLLQFVHQDDAGRFFARAALGGPTGAVNLAADDVVTPRQMAELVGRPLVELPPRAADVLLRLLFRLGASEVDPEAMNAVEHLPVVTTHRLRDEFGFRPALSSAETVVDMMRAASRYVSFGPRVVHFPRRLPFVDPRIPLTPPADGGELVQLLPDGWAGQFDTPIDPRFAEYTSNNLSEAFPGPMTPLTIDVSLDALRSSAQGAADIFGFEGPVSDEVVVRGAVALGHRMYGNVSAIRELARSVPGMTPDDVDHQYLGKPLPASPPKLTPRDAMRALRLGARAAPKIAGLAAEAERAHATADALRRSDDALATMADEAVLAHLEVCHDELVQAWNVSCTMNFVAGGAWSQVERVLGLDVANGLRGDVDDLSSARTLQGVRELARRARDDGALRSVLHDGAPADVLAALPGRAPAFAAAFERLVAEVGHRGPGETELANEVFADRPELLFDAVVKSLDAPDGVASAPVVLGGARGALVRLALRQLRVRERARDAAMRLTHELRRAVREHGRRLVAAGALDDPADVVYLRYDELAAPPRDARAVVAARRAERAHLATRRLPGFLRPGWAPPVDDGSPGAEGGRDLTGIAASPGVVQGRVRVLRDPEGLEPGEILVTEMTDVGWTPVFAFAGGLVTDLGGALSHAAVVAREFGLPAVVGTQTATVDLRDGMLIEVDGAAGTVRILEG